MSPTTIFAPASTPAQLIFSLSSLVVAIVIAIFVVDASLLAYAVIRFRRRLDDDRSEPPQVYGSNRVELTWTGIPILIVIVLFLGSARVITSVENDPQANATTVVAVGHQFWWEYRYPSLGGAALTVCSRSTPADAAHESNRPGAGAYGPDDRERSSHQGAGWRLAGNVTCKRADGLRQARRFDIWHIDSDSSAGGPVGSDFSDTDV